MYLFIRYTFNNHRINRIHERSLRIILNDYDSSFNDLLARLDEKTIHQRTINFLLIEVYKFLNGLSPELMNEVFHIRHTYDLQQTRLFQTDDSKSKSSQIRSIFGHILCLIRTWIKYVV